jgi:hypothetical protein
MPSPGRRFGRRSGVPVAASPEGLPTRRRWGRFAAGATLALLGAWVFAALYVSAGQRVEVLALAHDVDQFHKLEDSDFKTVRVAAEDGVETVKASHKDDMVGRVTGVPVVQGSLLAENELVPKDQPLVEPSERVVWMHIDAGLLPDSKLLGGTQVDVYISPDQPGGEPQTVPGCWILKVGEPEENTNKVSVGLVAPASDGEKIAAAALDEKIAFGAHGKDQ